MCCRGDAVLILLLAACRLSEWLAGADVACIFEFVTSLCRGKLIYCYSLSFVRLFSLHINEMNDAVSKLNRHISLKGSLI